MRAAKSEYTEQLDLTNETIDNDVCLFGGSTVYRHPRTIIPAEEIKVQIGEGQIGEGEGR